jgi:hypothetical protein
LSLVLTKADKQLSPWTQPGLASLLFPLSTHKTAVLIWCMNESLRGRFCLQRIRAAIGSRLLAESTLNPSAWKVLHKLHNHLEVRTLPKVSIHRIAWYSFPSKS